MRAYQRVRVCFRVSVDANMLYWLPERALTACNFSCSLQKKKGSRGKKAQVEMECIDRERERECYATCSTTR